MTILALALLLQDPDVVTVTLNFKDAPLLKVVAAITKETGVPIELAAAVKKDLEETQETATVKFEKVSVTTACRLLFGVRGDLVTIVDKKKILVSRP